MSNAEYMRKKRASDPAFRETERQRAFEYRRTHTDWKEKNKLRLRELRAQKDPGYIESKKQSFERRKNIYYAAWKARRASESPKQRASRLARQKEYHRKWALKNPGRAAVLAKRFHESHPDRASKYYRTHYLKSGYLRLKQRRETDVNYAIKCRLRNRIRDAFRHSGLQKTGRTCDLVGCTIPELRAHLEKQFKPGMTWDNHGRGGWSIDHRVPCAEFDLRSEFQQLQCFNWRNLQPLWEKQNLSKGAKLTHPYQRTLAL